MLSALSLPRNAAVLVWIVVLGSCAAPISYEAVQCKTPEGNHSVFPLSDALRELEAGKSTHDPLIASGHFVESARLAGQKAMAGEPGAIALYNHAVARLVERLEENKSLPWGKTITVGCGAIVSTLHGKLETGAPTNDRRYVPADTLQFKGVYGSTKATREGIGAPLVAISRENNRDYRRSYTMPRAHVALTAVLRFQGKHSCTLELHDPLEEERLSISGRNPSLAADFTAPAALFMSVERPDKLGLPRLINPQKYSDTARLTRIQNYDKDRIPVLFVHGLQDTPVTWAPMYFHLMQDPLIRDRYQFWFFSYPSGYPYPYSASLLRKELDGIKRTFPDHKDIIIVGHSMGGIISRLMVTDAGDKIWRTMLGKGPDEMTIHGASRQLLLDSYVFGHRAEIDRAIFISAPHRGSELASNWVGRLSSRLVRMPTFLTDARNSLASVLTADGASLQLGRAPNSIDTLSPRNPFVREINKLPIAPGITYHSIMGDRGKGGNKDHTRPMSSDGVVPFWSSHIDGAASEKIVPSNHSAHQNPEGIEEVHRILKLHLRTAPAR